MERSEYQRWYKLKLWCHKPTGLRWRCLIDALFTCKQCGFQAQADETHLLHADHIVPHRGDWDLFIDPLNLRCLCETCHNAGKQQEEHLGYSTEMSLDGFPLDPKHPGAG